MEIIKRFKEAHFFISDNRSRARTYILYKNLAYTKLLEYLKHF